MTDLQLSLQGKLTSGLYNISQIVRDTDISRFWLNKIKDDGDAPAYILVALNDYFNKKWID